MKTNFVESEFAPLKRVVLAQSQFCLPEKENELDTSFLSEKNLDLFRNKVGDIADLYPEMQLKWENEKEQMSQLLTSYGVEVIRPRMLTKHEKELGKKSGHGYANFFSRDPFFTIGHFIIEGNLRFTHRRLEGLPIRAILLEESNHPEAIYAAVPQPDISQGIESETGPFLEGGDVLVYGKTIFVGYSGLASNLNGINWLKSFLAHWDYTIVPVRLHPEILHLDCALSMVKEGLMIYCEEAFLDGLPQELNAWDKINVSLKEASVLMTNGLPLNESVYITDQSFTKLIADLEKQGMKVETLDYEISRIFGGSFRCTTQALLRTTN
ncbi:amidinotransferase [Enterococcus moraviensis ATCC BAA-383]|uniref:Amidinotransferase n=1 Tax=Enterococcus moraviensis ATCC BAA-383 TaxID=1158609 RepID=R2QH92_9ENTE|nr:arginine deiminase family protein [Enterococcus moraviensis]EOH95917.1 amidinotransferase [Enterococcus moraviensis ATCC BAA-383]EOT66404.1 amidinotransferase [Enterococcus moraviensis ATCC BAA-383]OJG67531.1 amidinotransferase [Enterococcus moraviensis]